MKIAPAECLSWKIHTIILFLSSLSFFLWNYTYVFISCMYFHFIIIIYKKKNVSLYGNFKTFHKQLFL